MSAKCDVCDRGGQHRRGSKAERECQARKAGGGAGGAKSVSAAPPPGRPSTLSVRRGEMGAVVDEPTTELDDHSKKFRTYTHPSSRHVVLGHGIEANLQVDGQSIPVTGSGAEGYMMVDAQQYLGANGPGRAVVKVSEDGSAQVVVGGGGLADPPIPATQAGRMVRRMAYDTATDDVSTTRAAKDFARDEIADFHTWTTDDHLRKMEMREAMIGKINEEMFCRFTGQPLDAHKDIAVYDRESGNVRPVSRSLLDSRPDALLNVLNRGREQGFDKMVVFDPQGGPKGSPSRRLEDEEREEKGSPFRAWWS